MSTASRMRGVAVLMLGTALLAGCTGGSDGSTTSGAPAPTASPSSASPTPTATPSPTPTVPPLTPGRSSGAMIVVQQAEDASLVAGEQPIRLTLARTANRAAWITSPPQKLSGTMTTEQAMLSLGWRPSADGTTSRMPTPRPNGLLAHAGGTLAFTVQRASVRPDGTLVLDIKPLAGAADTVESFGPVALTLDGAPGVLDFTVPIGDLTVRVVVTGRRSQQAAVQVLDGAGQILESGFVAAGRPIIDTWLDITSGTTTWSTPVVTFEPPQRSREGTIRITGTVTIDGVATNVDQVVARWSLPLA